jgi:hypothetical protein
MIYFLAWTNPLDFIVTCIDWCYPKIMFSKQQINYLFNEFDF